MINAYKPGGGNKPQPYIPAGNGEKSGEYTINNNINFQNTSFFKYAVQDNPSIYNFYNSVLVKKVISIATTQNHSIPTEGAKNSVCKKTINDYIVSERYYNENGEAYLDIDYTCHGNPTEHIFVPHIHRWAKNKNGNLERGDWEKFI